MLIILLFTHKIILKLDKKKHVSSITLKILTILTFIQKTTVQLVLSETQSIFALKCGRGTYVCKYASKGRYADA